jgi:PEP-CTERM motif
MRRCNAMALRMCCLVAATALWLTAADASAQTVTYNFEDLTDQGFGTGFGNDASATYPIVNIGGSNRMEVLDTASFQQAGRETGNPTDLQYIIMALGAIDETLVTLSYDWYIDTSLSPGNYGNFLQLGTYVNTGDGTYQQDFPAIKDVELNGAQLASGQIFSGTVSETFAAKGFNIPLGNTFFRFGLISNGDGTQAKIYFDNIRLTAVPEPASFALVGMGAIGLVGFVTRRRGR